MAQESRRLAFNTRAIHAGEAPDPVTGASAPNLVMSTTFVTDPGASFSAEDFGEATPFIYTRWGNPTVDQLERKLASLEEAEACIAFGSGMAAITALFFHVLKPGDHLIISDVTYAATAEFSKDFLPRLGIEVTKVDMSDARNVAAALRGNTRLIYAETPANPLIRLTDILAVGKLAKEAKALFAVDSTFATPVATRPLRLGADFVLHSLTKYLGGHGDAIGGAILGGRAALAEIKKGIAIRTGGILSPFNAWLIMRGIATLPIRMKAHQEGASAVASFLEGHPKVKRVIYPGLASHPQHALARRQMDNFSGMLTFQVADGPAAGRLLAERLEVIHYAVSLGHHRSLIFYLATEDMLRTSFALGPEAEASYRSFAGDGIFRFSAGLEDPRDLCEDLDRALAAIP